jgi:hypothetical protein
VSGWLSRVNVFRFQSAPLPATGSNDSGCLFSGVFIANLVCQHLFAQLLYVLLVSQRGVPGDTSCFVPPLTLSNHAEGGSSPVCQTTPSFG